MEAQSNGLQGRSMTARDCVHSKSNHGHTTSSHTHTHTHTRGTQCTHTQQYKLWCCCPHGHMRWRT
jgi:hypothetical protein